MSLLRFCRLAATRAAFPRVGFLGPPHARTGAPPAPDQARSGASYARASPWALSECISLLLGRSWAGASCSPFQQASARPFCAAAGSGGDDTGSTDAAEPGGQQEIGSPETQHGQEEGPASPSTSLPPQTSPLQDAARDGPLSEDASAAAGSAAASASDPIGEQEVAGTGAAEARSQPAVTEDDFDATLMQWARVISSYSAKAVAHEQQEEMRARSRQFQQEVDVSNPQSDAGGIADRTDAAPVDTRVWMHMFEGEDGNPETSFCPRTGDAHFMYDFIGFRDMRVEQNALLSDEAKCLMFQLHSESPDVWDSAALAGLFRIREERALAILKLKAKEFEQADALTLALNRLQEIFGQTQNPTVAELNRPRFRHTVRHMTAWFERWLALYDAIPYLMGRTDAKAPASGGDSEEDSETAETAGEGDEDSAEAADASDQGDQPVPSVDAKDESKDAGEQPAKRTLSEAEIAEVVQLHNLLSEAANREAKHIACTRDMWQCVYNVGSGERHYADFQTMPSFEEFPLEDVTSWSKSEYRHACETLAERQNQAAIEQFKLRLAWNIGETGQGVQREHRRRGQEGATVPKKPEGGWPILVVPLSPGRAPQQPFVAMPNGEQRPLSDDEKLYLQHFKRQPRMFSRPRKHAPFTNETLHAFQRKPNKKHDLYNSPYAGNVDKKTPTSGPERIDLKRKKMFDHIEARKLKQMIASLQ